MAKIIPIRDLRKGAEISEFVKTSGEPIFVTKNGYGDMVIMSMETYEKQFLENAIYTAVTKSVEQVRSGAKTKLAKDVFADLEKRHEKQ